MFPAQRKSSSHATARACFAAWPLPSHLGFGASMLWAKMASNASSDVEPEDEKTDNLPNKTGRAAEYPEFAIIWSFLENFRDLLHFPVISLETLEDAFDSHLRVNG